MNTASFWKFALMTLFQLSSAAQWSWRDWVMVGSYLEVIQESMVAATFFSPTGGEVIAEFAGGISAVQHKLGTESVVHISSGVPHNTGAYC